MASPSPAPPSFASDMTTVEAAPSGAFQEEKVGSRTPVIVAFAEHDAGDPRAFSPARKWFFTFGSSLSLLCISVAATIYSSGIAQMTDEYGVGTEVVTLGLSIYQLGFAAGPLIFAPLSEQFGRRPVFLVTFACYVLFTLGTALAKTIGAMVVCRFFAGFWGSSVLATSPAIIGDLFNASDRGTAMNFFVVAAFGGPVVGPIAGSFLAQEEGYRWLFWLCLIFSGVCFLAGATVPETFAPVILEHRADRLLKSTGQPHRSIHAPADPQSLKATLLISLRRPFELLFREKIVAFFAIYSALIYGLLYGFFGAFPYIFRGQRGWSPGVASLPFLGIGCGMLLAIGANAHLNRSYVAKTKAAEGRQLPPEARLPLCCAGGVAFFVGLIMLAFTADKSVHWIVPVISGAPFGFGLVSVFLVMQAYLLDCYPTVAASAIACTAFTRSLAGCAFPLFIRQQLDGMTVRWALFLYAVIAFVAMPVPFLLLKYGERIRATSRYAPSTPKSPAAEPQPPGVPV